MAKGKMKRIEHEIHDDKTVGYTIHRETGGKNRGSFLMDSTRETGTHKTAKEAGAHLTKVLSESGVQDADPSGAPKGGKTKVYDDHPTSDDGRSANDQE